MKKTIFKRILCVFFAVFILAVLAIPAAAHTYFPNDLPDDTFPSNMVFAMNGYNNNYTRYRIAFKSGEEMPNYWNYPLTNWHSNYVTAHRAAYDSSFGFEVSYIDNDTYTVGYHDFTVYVCITYGDDEYIISFSSDYIDRLLVFDRSDNLIIYEIDASNAVFSSPDTAISGVPYDLISGINIELQGQRSQSDNDIINWSWWVQSNSGAEFVGHSVPYWFVAVDEPSVHSSGDLTNGDYFLFSLDQTATYYYNASEFVPITNNSSGSGSGTTDPGNNSGSGSGTSDPGNDPDPGEIPSTPVSEEEEAVSVLSSLRDFVFSIFMAPSIFLSSILDFNILGINLYTVVKVILTLCLVAFVVALVVKLILHLR